MIATDYREVEYATNEYREVEYAHLHVRELHEHGQGWLVCHVCGATWSIVLVEISGEVMLDVEEIEPGDESCLKLEEVSK